MSGKVGKLLKFSARDGQKKNLFMLCCDVQSLNFKLVFHLSKVRPNCMK